MAIHKKAAVKTAQPPPFLHSFLFILHMKIVSLQPITAIN
jgi:hypothetical protein